MRSGLATVAILSYLGEYTLPRLAFPLVLLGEPIDPHRAQQIGLISQVCPTDRLSAAADTLVKASTARRQFWSKEFCGALRKKLLQRRTAEGSSRRIRSTKGSLALLARKK